MGPVKSAVAVVSALCFAAGEIGAASPSRQVLGIFFPTESPNLAFYWMLASCDRISQALSLTGDQDVRSLVKNVTAVRVFLERACVCACAYAYAFV